MRIERSLWRMMSKRSVDRGDKGKNAQAQAPEARAEDVPSVSLAQKAKARSGAGFWQKSEHYWHAGLIVIALFSFYLRAIIPWNAVFVGDKVIFSSETDAWYNMMLAKTTVINLQRLWFDPMTNFPHGTPIPWGPFWDWSVTIFSYIFGLGHPSMHTVDVVGALMPAVLGALVVFPVYFIGKEIGGKSCGIVSALIIAVLPGMFLSRTTLGFSDHHAAESLLSALTIMFFLLALRHGRSMTLEAVQKNLPSLKTPLLYAALAGISLGLYIDAWATGFLFEGIILAFIFLQSISDHIRGRNIEYLGISGAVTFFVATLLVLPFVKPFYGFNYYLYSLFQPTILLLGVAVVILFCALSKYLRAGGYNRYYYPGAIALLVVLGTIVLTLAIPQFTDPLFYGLSIFQPKTGGAATVGEVSPLLYYGGEFSWVSLLSSYPALGNIVFLSSFFLALAGLALLLWRYARRQRPNDLLIIVWSLTLLVLTLAQSRFSYYYEVNVAVLTGFLAFWVMQKFGVLDEESESVALKDPVKFLTSNLKVIAAALLIFVIVIYPALSTSMIVLRYVGGPESDWLTSTGWLENNTPSPGLELYKIYQDPLGKQYPYPDAAYGIMSWWDFGHLIETVGHRIPNANPFQQGIGSAKTGTSGSSPFFIAENESQAEKVLAGLDPNRSLYMNTKYVMIDFDMATSKFHAITAWSGISHTNYIGAVYQQQGDQIVPVTLWLEPYFKTMVARMYFLDGSEVKEAGGVGIAYRGVQLEDGSTVSVMAKTPLMNKNLSEMEAFVNESRSEGYFAVIASTSPTLSAVPLEALKHYRLVHESETSVTTNGQKLVKTFEHVPGAVIEGSAAPGTTVTIQVPVLTNKGRTFVYQQSNVTDSNGEFTLVAPYSTEGPIVGGTNFDTKPMGPYRLSVGDETYEVRVPEEYVLSGMVVKV
ncbi:MAG: Dolichyl-monophosphooligosaccharide--protein glycosyltransferase AglB [Methanosaeta sp. PtaU1.Bin060]|nr:MAG: Dolichyl-monophosphooligosaccharide--protein glycosyltransferase AglB [Methanosaeta sp. PtaU1.Bin060]